MTSQNDTKLQRVYIGTYTQGTLHIPHENVCESRGIYTALFDPATGVFGNLELAAATPNPSYLAKHPKHPILYGVNECFLEEFQNGGLSVFRIENEQGDLTPLGCFDSKGQAPCHLAVDPQGRFLLISNYRNGRFVRHSLDRDGIPHGEPTVFQSHGKGPNEKRQDGPHAHSTNLDPLTNNILMIDLGVDTIYVREYDESSKSFSTDNRFDLKVAPGSGCRHSAFLPDGKILYVIDELDAAINVFFRNENNSFEGPVQRISTLPQEIDSNVQTTASAIVVHPSGKYLYASNRGSGIVSIFDVGKDGRLSLQYYCDAKCKTPRFCCLSPDEKYLIVCGQDSASIEAFHIDPASGQLFPNEKKLSVDSPVCVIWTDQ